MTTTAQATIHDDEVGQMTLAPWHGPEGGYALWHRGDVVWKSADLVMAPPFPRPAGHTVRFQSASGDTFEEIRANAWRQGGIAQYGDAILVWVNEGDFWMVGTTEVKPTGPVTDLRDQSRVVDMPVSQFPAPPTSEQTDD